MESHISNLINRLNDSGPTDQATIIRLKQAQILNWEPTNILTQNIPDSFDCDNNFSAITLKTANNFGINLSNSRLNEIFQYNGGNFSIKSGLNNNELYKKSRNSIRNRKLMFIDQLIDDELKVLLPWKIIKVSNSNNRNGPEPNWYKELRIKITENNNFILNSTWRSLSWIHTNNIHCKPISTDGRIKE